MPNYTNSGYGSQATPALRLAMARLFKAELTDKITADITKDSTSRNNQSLNQLLMRVDADIEKLEAQVATRTGGGLNRVVRGTAL